MAFRRSVAARANTLYQQQRVAVPFSHIDRDDGDSENLPRHSPIYNGSGIPDILRQRRQFAAGPNLGGFHGSRNLFQDRRFAIPAVSAAASVARAAPAVGEVAAAAADSFLPVAALQYLIDYVHKFTGLNWWSAIVVTTVLIRTLQLPFTIHHIKATSKFTLIRPKLEEIQQEMKDRDMSPAAVLEGQAKMKKLFKEYGVTPFTHLKGILFIGPVFTCFFLAIKNMVEKVQSFQQGGAFWFTDLTTPDTMYIFPVLSALTFWIMLECNAQEGLQANPAAKTIKNVLGVFAALMVPLTASFSKAIFCYWITSNPYSAAYGLVIKKPEVKKMLGIPDIPVPPPSANQKPGESFFEVLKKYNAAQRQLNPLPPPTDRSLSPPQQSSSPSSAPPPSANQKPGESFFEVLKKYNSSLQQLNSLPPPTDRSLTPPEQSSSPSSADEMSKPGSRKLRSTPSSALSRRIKKLGKEVKGRKKGNKRSSG
ncbi:mitochondrial inner membrane protein OXA1-like isoform X2 [Salvia hispanica]|uniref:mitochondrial inner membrane protein OXA1-like isoform X2 n=1 Tax=Salvia hispanica TaxID=49212 RepID=UPI002009803C|nr:mitochondrial inner membrane protein OXA1-like isoform X2 [Salvia hispanica]